MTIFVVWRVKDKKFMGGFVDTRAIFELPPDTYTVCVAEEGKVTKCQTITLTTDKKLILTPKSIDVACREAGWIREVAPVSCLGGFSIPMVKAVWHISANELKLYDPFSVQDNPAYMLVEVNRIG